MSEKDTSVPRNTLLSRFLTAIERLGNALPHPATLFAILAFGLILLSWLFSKLGVSAVNPTDGAPVIPINLISRDGLHWILEKTIENYTVFAPLGTVLMAMLGIGVAEKSGLIGTGLRLMVHAAPRRLLTFVIVFTGVMSNLASDIGYVLLVPLGPSSSCRSGATRSPAWRPPLPECPVVSAPTCCWARSILCWRGSVRKLPASSTRPTL